MNILAFGIGNLGGPDLFIILLIVLVLFGAKKLLELARSLGVVLEDATSGMSQIHTAEIKPDVWTLTRFLSRRPIKNTYGEIETPETLGLIPTKIKGDYGIAP
jgi:sec-independent protein translocase protein TatA